MEVHAQSLTPVRVVILIGICSISADRDFVGEVAVVSVLVAWNDGQRSESGVFLTEWKEPLLRSISWWLKRTRAFPRRWVWLVVADVLRHFQKLLLAVLSEGASAGITMDDFT